MPPVRLFVGNLPYQATEDDLRYAFLAGRQAHPDRSSARPRNRPCPRIRVRRVRGAQRRRRGHPEIDGQLFMGRPLAVSEARAREDRGPGGPPRPRRIRRPAAGRIQRWRRWRRLGGAASAVGGGFGGRGGGRRAAPATGRHAKAISGRRLLPRTRRSRSRRKRTSPRGPIPTKFTGRMYDLDDNKDEDAIDITPEFMKHEDPEVEAPDAEAAADAATTDAGDTRRR